MSHGIIHTGFWSDKKVKAWPVQAKLLAAYFITGPHRNILGCALIPDGYIIADLGWDEDTLRGALATLVETKFILRDGDGWTLVLNQLKHDPLKHENHVKGAARLLASVPVESPVYEAAYSRLSAASEAIGRPLAGVSKPIPAPAPSPSPSPIPEGSAIAGQEPAPVSFIFGSGLRWLKANSGKTESECRSLIGKWRKTRGDPDVAAALVAAQQSCVSDPVGWISKRFSDGKSSRATDFAKDVLEVGERLQRSRELHEHTGSDG